MRLRLEIGGVGLDISGPSRVIEAMRRFEPFAAPLDRTDDVKLEIAEAHADFEPDLRLDQLLAVQAAVEPHGILLRGAVRGGYDRGVRRGWLEAPRNLGEVDGLVRLALSIELPRRGALLLHAAAVVPLRRDGALVLAGASGAGKSTSASSLGRVLSDELSVVLVGGKPCVCGTPYWNGQPERAPLDRIVVLERGAAAAPETLAGGRAVAALAPHLVRYVADEALDREVFALAAELCERAHPTRLCCPEGDAFLPHLRNSLVLV